MIATQPVPVQRHVEEAAAPSSREPPCTFWMSQSMPESNASTLAPLHVMASFSSLSRWTSCAVSARNTSPVPLIFISWVPSPVHGLLEHPAHAARAGVLEAHLALVGDHRAELGLDRDLVEADLQQLASSGARTTLGLRLLKLAEGALHPASLNLLRLAACTVGGSPTGQDRDPDLQPPSNLRPARRCTRLPVMPPRRARTLSAPAAHAADPILPLAEVQRGDELHRRCRS